MKPGWRDVRLSEVAHPIQRPVLVEAGTLYRTLGVKWWGGGAYERQTIDGSQTAAQTLSIVREGDLIINKIWVRHGSTAIVTNEVDGCAASGEFPTFDLDRSLILPGWMHWLSKTPLFWAMCAELSQGTSGKNRITPEKFLTITLPLPPIEEQQRIVLLLDQLAVKTKEAQSLRHKADQDCENLCRSMLSDISHSSTLRPMKELVRQRPLDVVVRPEEIYHFAGVYSFGKGVFRGPIKSGEDFAYGNLTRLKAGNFVYPKLMAWEGALGTVPPDCNGLVVSPEFPVFEVNENEVLPEVLDVYFRTPRVWPALSGTSTGTNVRRRRLNPSTFLEFKMPIPPMGIQQKIREVKNKLDALKPLQEETSMELSALLNSSLDKAFKGEL